MEKFNFFKDTLMEWDKHKQRYAYSMRRVTIAAFIPIIILLGIYIVISDRWLGLKTVNIYAIQVLNSFLMFVGLGLGLNLASYIKNEPPKKETDNSNLNDI